MKSTKLPSWIEGLLGLSPRPGPPHVFYVGPGRLTYGRFVADGGVTRVEALGTRELPPSTFQKGLLGGPLKEEGAFGSALQEILAAEAPMAHQVQSRGRRKRERGGIAEASLVLPDAWLRLAFTEVGELPKDAGARDDVLRWKLKRLVPFRVEELRITGTSVSPLAQQAEPYRMIMGFALESLLTNLEQQFAAAGILVGQITNASLSLLATLGLTGDASGAEGERLHAVALVTGDGYTLTFARGGEPVLQRFKGDTGEVPLDARRQLVHRDLRLTRSFLEEHFPATPLAEVHLAAEVEDQGGWREWLAEGLGSAVRLVDAESLPPVEMLAAPRPWPELAPMLGASRLEVA